MNDNHQAPSSEESPPATTDPNIFDELRQEYISQPDAELPALEKPKHRFEFYLDKKQRLTLLASLLIVALILGGTTVVISGAWNRYTKSLQDEVVFEELPAHLEEELIPEPIPTETPISPPEDPVLQEPLPEEYILPEVTPWPTPP